MKDNKTNNKKSKSPVKEKIKEVPVVVVKQEQEAKEEEDHQEFFKGLNAVKFTQKIAAYSPEPLDGSINVSLGNVDMAIVERFGGMKYLSLTWRDVYRRDIVKKGPVLIPLMYCIFEKKC